MTGTSTRERILDAALDRFGRRGVGAVSLDEIAREVGVRKQTVLYWFPSKDALVDGVLESVAAQLGVVIEAAIRAAPDDPVDRVDAVVKAVFRPAVRRPALLGLLREVSRLDPAQADRLRRSVQPLVDRAVAYLAEEMDRGRLRRGDPGLVAALAYATVTGLATEPEALGAVGWQPSAAGLRRLRDELRAFLRAALVPAGAPEDPAGLAGGRPQQPGRVTRS
jgi:AcrR family transcriptional regulator